MLGPCREKSLLHGWNLCYRPRGSADQIYPCTSLNRTPHVYTTILQRTAKYVQLLRDTEPAHLGCQIYPAPTLRRRAVQTHWPGAGVKASFCRMAHSFLETTCLDCRVSMFVLLRVLLLLAETEQARTDETADWICLSARPKDSCSHPVLRQNKQMCFMVWIL